MSGEAVVDARSRPGTTVTRHLDAPATAVFEVLTDPHRLPEWNAAIRSVVDAPAALAPGVEWVVELHVLGRTWHSRSRVQELDPQARTFAYRSQTDDGNPSSADWRWHVTEATGGGSVVTVAMSLHPRTFWRRVLLVHVRRAMLRHQELGRSLAALEGAARRSRAGA